MSASQGKSSKDKDKHEGDIADNISHEQMESEEKCLVFEAQTWRRYQCKNCFKTREEHEAPIIKDSDSNAKPAKAKTKDTQNSAVSSMAAKFLPKGGEHQGKGEKGGKGGAQGDKGSGSPKISGGDSLIAQRTAGLFKKDAENIQKGAKGRGGKKGKKGSGDAGKGASLNGTKKGTGALSPIASNKSPQTSPCHKSEHSKIPRAGSSSPSTAKSSKSAEQEKRGSNLTGKKHSKSAIKSSKDMPVNSNTPKPDRSSPSDETTDKQQQPPSPSGRDSHDECISLPATGGGVMDSDVLKIVEQVTVVGGDEVLGECDGGDDLIAQSVDSQTCEGHEATDQTYANEFHADDEDASPEVSEVVSFCSMELPMEVQEQQASTADGVEEEQTPPTGEASNTTPTSTYTTTLPTDDNDSQHEQSTPLISPNTTGAPPSVQIEQKEIEQIEQEEGDWALGGVSGSVGVPLASLPTPPLLPPTPPLIPPQTSSVPGTPSGVTEGRSATPEKAEEAVEEEEGQPSRANQGEEQAATTAASGPLEDDPSAPGCPGGEVGGELGAGGERRGESSDAGAGTTQGTERGQGTEGHTDAARSTTAASVEPQQEHQQQEHYKSSHIGVDTLSAAQEDTSAGSAADITHNFSFILNEDKLAEKQDLPLIQDPVVVVDEPARGESPSSITTTSSSTNTNSIPVGIETGLVLKVDDTNNHTATAVVGIESLKQQAAAADTQTGTITHTLPPSGDSNNNTPSSQEGTEQANSIATADDILLTESAATDVCAIIGSEEENSSWIEAGIDELEPEVYSADDKGDAAFHATFVLTTEASQETETEDFNIFSASEKETEQSNKLKENNISIISTEPAREPQTEAVTVTWESLTEGTEADTTAAQQDITEATATENLTATEKAATQDTVRDLLTNNLASPQEETVLVILKGDDTVTELTDSVTVTALVESVTEIDTLTDLTDTLPGIPTQGLAKLEEDITECGDTPTVTFAAESPTTEASTEVQGTEFITDPEGITSKDTDTLTDITYTLTEDIENLQCEGIDTADSETAQTDPELIATSQADLIILLPTDQHQEGQPKQPSQGQQPEGQTQEEVFNLETRGEYTPGGQEELIDKQSEDQLTSPNSCVITSTQDTPVDIPQQAISVQAEPGGTELYLPGATVDQLYEYCTIASPGSSRLNQHQTVHEGEPVLAVAEQTEAPPGVICQHQHQQGDSEFNPDTIGLSDSDDIILLVCPHEGDNDDINTGSETNEASVGVIKQQDIIEGLQQQPLSPEDPTEQWYETQTELPPPAAFSDTNSPVSSITAQTLGGDTSDEQLPPTTSPTDDPAEGQWGEETGGIPPGEDQASWRSGNQGGVAGGAGDSSVPEASVIVSSSVSQAGSYEVGAINTLGLLAIDVSSTPGADLGSHSNSSNCGLLSVATSHEEYHSLSGEDVSGEEDRPREAVSPLVVRPSGETFDSLGGEGVALLPSTTQLTPLSVEITSSSGCTTQTEAQYKTPTAPPTDSVSSSDVTKQEGNGLDQGVVEEEREAVSDSVAQLVQTSGLGEERPPSPQSRAHLPQTGGVSGEAQPTTNTTSTTHTQPTHTSPTPVTGHRGVLAEQVATSSLIITATSRNTSQPDADNNPVSIQPAQKPETEFECEPTFRPRVVVAPGNISSNSSNNISSSNNITTSNKTEVKVAAATISLKQPSQLASTSQEPVVIVEGQTCVSKVASFIISAPNKQGQQITAARPDNTTTDLQNNFTNKPKQTLVINNSKYDYDSGADVLSDVYGGQPQQGSHYINNDNEQSTVNFENNNIEDKEDVPPIQTIKSKKKIRQRPAHQQLQFDRTYQRSSSVPDNSIFCIASHKPGDSTEQEADSYNFDRTLQFGPSGRQRRRRMSDAFVREDAMMEGTRMLIENLREKQHLLEEKCARLEREKAAVSDLLTVKKHELHKSEVRSCESINSLEITCIRLESENVRLLERMNLPETDRNNFRDQEVELAELRRKLAEAEEVISQLSDDSACLQHEVKDMHLEMEEMHDQFRDDEALEFRDMQKELEATAKNCRILQFKLRKAERRNDALQSERLHFDEKIRHLESRSSNNTEQNQIRELEEELRMAKEVSVRLHDELEATEDRRAKFQDELERVHDVLADSEKGRGVLQKEVLTLTEEVEQLRERVIETTEDGGDKLDVPRTRKPLLSKTGSQGSQEYDVEQLMRDLADSLEREHDLKGQLEHAEEETINFRKKLSDLEDENEVIQIQLQKMASAKSGKYFQKSIDDTDQVSEEEHELRLQLELAEEEINVLRRKVDEMDLDNATMTKEVRRLQLKLAGKDSKDEEQLEDTRSYDERITAMACDIDDLKWRLIQKDQESASKDNVERLSKDRYAIEPTELDLPVSRPVKLCKSLSLDSGSLSADIWKQLDSAAIEAYDLKDKILNMEKENEELRSRNKALELGVPTITTDDAPIKNIELQDKIRSLKSENAELRETIRSLDDRTTALSRDVNKVNDGRVGESTDLKEQLRHLEEELASFQRTITELQDSNKKLTADLRQYEQTDEGKESKAASDDLNLETATKRQLRERIKDLESDMRVLTTIVKNRESENKSFEREVEEYRIDMDKMLDKFKDREANLQMELQSWEQKNVVLSNLLDLVTERAESLKSSPSEKQSERSTSVVSTVSDVTMGSDEVFGEKAEKDWDEKFLCRIRSLEDLLKEERQKVQAVEKRLEVKDGEQSALTDDMKLHEREKEILQQEQIQKQILEQERGVIQEELILCQRQLTETTEQSQGLRDKLDTMHKIQGILRSDFQRVSTELDTEKSTSDDYKKKLDAKEAEGKTPATKEDEKEKKAPGARDAKFVGVGGLKDKEPASWRWEKQQFEATIKDLRKKADDLHRQLSRQQVRVKMAGDDVKPRLGRQDSVEADCSKSKELETDMKALKEEAEKRKTDIADMDKQIKELQTSLKSQEEQWNTEREVLEGDRKAVIKELTQKDEVLKAKDEIIKSKDNLLKQKESALKTRENSMLNHDAIMKEKDDIIENLKDLQNEALEQLEKLKEEVKQREEAHNEMEMKIKEVNAAVCARDGRIKEKDDIIEKLNRSMAEKESNLSDMDNAIRQAMKSMDDKESDIKTLQAQTEDQKIQLEKLKSKSDNFEQTLHTTEKEHGKEIASLVILREKMEAYLQQLKTEKGLLEGEVQDIKRVMMEKEDFWRSGRNQLECDLRIANEKLHALECATLKGNQSEMIVKLTVEKDDLMNEKNILVKELKRLGRELENAEMDWTEERRKLSQAVSTKEGEIAELQARLSKQPGSAQASPAAASIDPRVEILRKAEIASIEELYENKLKIARQQLRQAQDEMDQMRKENNVARELLLSSQKTLSEVKHKYDVTVTNWHDEKRTLERRLTESDDRRKQVVALQRVVEQLEIQVTQLEAERTELNAKLMKSKADWDADKLELQAQANKYEEQAAMTSSGKFKWSEKSKRGAAWDSERANHQRALTEYQNLVRDLEVRAKTAERTREREQKELVAKLESCRSNMDREVTELRRRCVEGEEKATMVSGLQKTLIDLQYKLQSDHEVWLHQRTELQHQLADCEKIKLEEKNKFTELLAEVKKLKELTPLLSRSEGGVELEIHRNRKTESPQASPGGTNPMHSPHVFDLSPGSQREHTGNSVVTTIPIRRLVDDSYDLPLIEVLQHISQLAEDLNKISIKRSSKPTGPLTFRRSLSTSEVEEYREYAQQQEGESQPRMLDYEFQISTTPSTHNFQPTTRVSAAPSMSIENSVEDLTSPLYTHGSFRSRFPSAVPDMQVSKGTDRSSRPGSARNSMYASGTQSAYTSRDASPERRFGPKKITPYPVAPPSFLITPSRTPMRVTASMDREISMPEKHLQKLYDKLSAIEQEQTDEEYKTQQRLQREGSVEAYIEATDSRRKSGMRMLVKSMSVDSYRDDPNWMPSDAAPGPNAHFCPKQLDTVFDDAPKSQTLPASVRCGQTIIIPGNDHQSATDLSDLANKVEYLSTRRKSQDARKDFYENYPLYSSGFFSWPRKSRRDRHQEEMRSSLAATEEAQEAEFEAQSESVSEQKPTTTQATTAAVAPQQQQSEPKKTIVPFGKHKKKKEKDGEAEKKESKLSYFFSSVKERRSMFMKKSRSVDESPVRKSVMKAGLQAGRPAAPSTFESPSDNKTVATEAKPPLPSATSASKSQPSSLRQKFHKRAASLDVTSLFSVSSGSREQSPANSVSASMRHSSVGTSSGATAMASSAGHTSGSGSKEQSRDGRKF